MWSKLFMAVNIVLIMAIAGAMAVYHLSGDRPPRALVVLFGPPLVAHVVANLLYLSNWKAGWASRGPFLWSLSSGLSVLWANALFIYLLLGHSI